MRHICFFLLAAACNCFAAQDKPACSFGEGSVTRQVAGFEIRIAPYRDKENPGLPQCRAVIRDASRKIVFSGHDSGFAIVLAGEDVNGDGAPDAVLEAYSGGAHCCWPASDQERIWELILERRQHGVLRNTRLRTAEH